MLSPTYTILIDWDSDNGLMIGDFESDLDGWSTVGTVLPTLARSTTRSYHADTSALITWGAAGTGPGINRVLTGLTSGVSYSLSAWIWVPTGSPNLRWAVVGGSTGTASSVKDAWVEITLSFSATAATHSVQIQPSSAPSAGNQAWVDMCRVTGPGEDVSARLPDRSTLDAAYGRDQARAYAPTRPGAASFELDNQSRDYSPEYTTSPLAGKLGPGRDVIVQATYSSKAYTLYRGRLDDYDVRPNQGEWLVRFTCLDGLATLKTVTISTALHPALRTGEAIGKVLDAAGWTGGRDLDPGGTTIRWWWEQDTTAYEALERIINSEGPGAFMAIGPSGQFLYRDRHHRLIRSESTSVQATFRDGNGAEPWFESPFEVDYGWRDILNTVSFKVEERAPAVVAAVVWSDTQQMSLAAGETRQVSVVMDDPVWAVQTPTTGSAITNDFVVTSGSVASVSMSRTAGQSLTMSVTAGGAGAIIVSMQLRGYPVTVARTIMVSREDTASIAKYGRRSYTRDAPWLNREDASAVADLILGQRAERLPIIQMQVINGSATGLTQLLQRDLSDRIRVIDTETGLDASFYIDQIQHRVSRNGLWHETTFGAEKLPTTPANLFTFDTTGKGFNDGVFGASGLDNPDTVFRFDTASHGFNDGLLAT